MAILFKINQNRTVKMKKIPVITLSAAVFLSGLYTVPAQVASKHSPVSQFPSYEGRVMCGYQGWFRAPGDGSGEGWTHYSEHGRLAPSTLHPDFWPDVSEYQKTYPTTLTNKDGTAACVFSSWDQSTTDLHFYWMQQYGIDGVFIQRFYGGLRTRQARLRSRTVLEHAIKSSQKYNRAIAIMYDLSGLRNHGEDCTAIIQDWKELVDELKITSQSTNNYLYHRGKPLVAIWGLGFPDRGYNIRDIGIEKVIDFLKHDPQYGGCSVMLGVPTYFRDLDIDCNPDPYLHQLIESADIVMPWMVQQFTPLLQLSLTLKTFCTSLRDGLHPAAYMHFGTNFLHMRPDSGHRNIQFVANFFVNKSLRQQLQDFSFPASQIVRFLGGNTHQMKMFDHFARNGAGHGRPTGMHVPNGFEQLIRQVRLDHVTVCPRLQSPKNPFAVLIDGHHDDLYIRK